ncbi:hypothetical protein Tco_0755321 [Tanacetum coccineum]
MSSTVNLAHIIDQALELALIQTKLSLEGRFILDDLDQRTLPLKATKTSPSVVALRNARFTVQSDRLERTCVLRGQRKSELLPASNFAPQLHESASGLPKTKLVSHSCSLAGSTSAMEVSIPIAFVLPGREPSAMKFKLRRPPAHFVKLEQI